MKNGMRIHGAVAACLLMLPSAAYAFDSVEGSTLGDQTPYFNFGGTVFFFPETLKLVDNRIVLQLGNAPDAALNLRPEQRVRGAGLSIEPIEGMHFGLWVSEYQNTLVDSFLTGGTIQSGFGGIALDGVSNSVPGWGLTATGDLGLVDAAALAVDENLGAGRKLDLFWAMDLNPTIALGARLWFGSQSFSVSPDESIGPIDIDTDSQVATGNDVGAEESLVVGDGSFGNSDFGAAIGTTFTGVPGLTLDVAGELNLIGVDWSPNDVDYVSADGLGYGVNLRGMYQVTPKWSFGGFGRYAVTSLGFEPQRRLDGSNLLPAQTNLDADTAGSLPDPSRDAPPQVDPDTVVDAGAVTDPVQGTEYSANQSELHVAAAGQWMPNSLATLYGSVGVRWDGYGDELAVGDFWSDEQDTEFFTRFVNIGVVGHVSSWMDLRIGASRRWTSRTDEIVSRDDRIPDNGNGPGAAGSEPPVGNEANTNSNRRETETSTTVDISNQAEQTQLSIGALLHYRGFQISGELDQGFVTDGLNFISGAENPLYVWVNFIYDWDYEQDAEVGYGDGTRRPDPHESLSGLVEPASSASPAAPARPTVTPPADEDEEPELEEIQPDDGFLRG